MLTMKNIAAISFAVVVATACAKLDTSYQVPTGSLNPVGSAEIKIGNGDMTFAASNGSGNQQNFLAQGAPSGVVFCRFDRQTNQAYIQLGRFRALPPEQGGGPDPRQPVNGIHVTIGNACLVGQAQRAQETFFSIDNMSGQVPVSNPNCNVMITSDPTQTRTLTGSINCQDNMVRPNWGMIMIRGNFQCTL